MTGPAPKHPSIRARRNNAKAGFTTLSNKGRKGPAPVWPLLPDVARTARLDLARDKVAALQVELESAEDGRTRGRLRRQIDQSEMIVATVSLELEQAGDLELAMWRDLWATPQAILWESSSAFARMLAQFVRWSIKGEQGDLDAAKEARIRGKEFGLTPLTLLGLKAEVEKVDEAEARGQRRRGPTPSPAQGEAKKPGEDDDPRGLYAVS